MDYVVFCILRAGSQNPSQQPENPSFIYLNLTFSLRHEPWLRRQSWITTAHVKSARQGKLGTTIQNHSNNGGLFKNFDTAKFFTFNKSFVANLSFRLLQSLRLLQTCQLSRFHRETHGLGYQLTVSRFGLQISRWIRKSWNCQTIQVVWSNIEKPCWKWPNLSHLMFEGKLGTIPTSFPWNHRSI